MELAPKEEARKLVGNFLNCQSNTEEIYDARQCASLCVDEKIKTLKNYCTKYNIKGECYRTEITRLQEVKRKIKNS